MLLNRRIFLFFIVTVPLLVFAVKLAHNIYSDSIQRSEIKTDYSNLNYINKGILSVTAWKNNITKIINRQIEDFELTQEQDSLLHLQLTKTIRALVDKADHAIQNDKQNFKGIVRNWVVQNFIHPAEIKNNAPNFSREIINEALKDENKALLKNIATSKLDDFSAATYDLQDSLEIKAIHAKYNVEIGQDINTILQTNVDKLEDKNYKDAFTLSGIIGLFLAFWIFIVKFPELQKPLFFMSIILAIITLLTGLTSAMIEIDARINSIDFVLLGETIAFKDQVIFYQSKSILQLVNILLTTGKMDAFFVGILVLLFSAVLPLTKLISTEVYLFGNNKWQNNKILHWLVFKSGKWSMADVMVVAIFMAYIGFNGILENQMEYLNTKSETMNSIATNQTSLQPGYILFIAYVIYGLILSSILKGIIKKKIRKSF